MKLFTIPSFAYSNYFGFNLFPIYLQISNYLLNTIEIPHRFRCRWPTRKIDHIIHARRSRSSKSYRIHAITRDTSLDAKVLAKKGLNVAKANFGGSLSLSSVITGPHTVFFLTLPVAIGPDSEHEELAQGGIAHNFQHSTSCHQDLRRNVH